MTTYIIAIRREARETVPARLDELLKDIDDLKIIGAANPHRLQVDASDEAIAKISETYGDALYIEPLIEHQPQPARELNHRLFTTRD